MNATLLSHCQSYLRAHSVQGYEEEAHAPRAGLTLSRETGAGAITTAKILLALLEKDKAGDPRFPWAVFDRELVKEVLEDHRLPKSVEEYLAEDIKNPVNDLMEDLLGVHPGAEVLAEYTNRTILRLALAGNVILVGRGANLITNRLPHMLHVRLVAPLEFRIIHVETALNLSREAAEEYVRKGDAAKARYVRKNFKTKVDEPTQYHLTINTAALGFEGAARLIADAVELRDAVSGRDLVVA